MKEQERNFKIVGGREYPRQAIKKEEILWCKRCGEAVGIYNPWNHQYVHDGNYCRHCGAKIEE